ncbi:formate--tetrahydrofolate ligase [Aminobacter sp. Y103A]|uniref:formate--tetrahydrofolate ligase n=1 Tax=Aminobacter sp. Y103A TaxID=1870862 RepID=UPI0025738CCE|nr:formate--tetrahydrofolate ligase [Aminobacter sp. SS-2016]BBD36092.1 formate--tetrahydrofolate ligase [Aminobacter sp. SS-2016]
MAEFKTDIEIARAAKKKQIQEVGAKIGIPTEHLLPYGHDKAKISAEFIANARKNKDGKLILVTAINPTPAGEGKTTTTVGLGDGLNRIGKKAIVCIREASLGPNFGVKGGAAGGGYAQVVPMEDMNLHFTGDFHAITTAHNLLSALIDNHIYWGNELGIDTRRVVWRRVMDMNDRALRQINCSLGGVANGFPREAGFDITVASEVMAILCLATDLKDLEKRLGDIIVAYRRDKTAVYARDLKADGAMAVLLKDAVQPNLVQTLENNENVEAVKKGCANLGRHIENVKQFGVPVVVAMNHFVSDTDAEIAAMKEYVASMGAEAILCKHWAKGSAGIEELAHKVVQLAESGASQFSPLYPDDMKLFDKIDTIVKRIYRGSEAIADKSVRDQLHAWEQAGYGHLPVCMAKTQYSFSTDPNLRGAPVDHVVPVREVRLAAGAGFIVAICGEIMTMPGLPKAPSSEKIFLNEQGQIEGLF